jgi:hemoglobin
VSQFGLASPEGKPQITMDKNLYETIGEEGFTRLIRAFYQQVPADDILGPMYPAEDIAGAEQRLRDFLIMRFGGPPRYLEQRGHPRLRMRHLPFPIGQRARDRWIELMDRALCQADLPEEAVGTLRRFFEDTATFMINRNDGA